MHTTTRIAALALGLAAAIAPVTSTFAAEDGASFAPVTNPLFFEDPHITSEVRPIFMNHTIDKGFATGGGDVRVYAAQLRWAVNERLAIIATKDGYIDFHPKAGLPKAEGFADLAAGLKYAVIDDKEHDFILTPGLKIELPTGGKRVLQGNGSGEWDVFVSSAKGFGDFHLTGNVGVRVPNDSDKENSQLHYSAQADYYVCKWFVPFASFNAFTVLTKANGVLAGLDTEGYDLVTFGSNNASGSTQAAIGGGFRSRLHKDVDLGFAYEKGVTSSHDLFDDRVTVDLIWRF